MNRRIFIKGTAGTVLAAVAGTSAVAWGVDTYDLEQTTVRLPLGLNKPLRVVAMGDFHYDPHHERAYMEEVCWRVNALQPDLVVFTGDFITNAITPVFELSALLGGISSRLGSWATLGNHDQWSYPDMVTSSLQKHGIHVLRNESVALPDEDAVFLTGLESFWAGRPDVTIFDRTPPDSRHIALIHEPDPFTGLDDPRIRLQISGHTHGGQVRCPLVGALRLPKFGKNYVEGLFREDGRHLYVNRGIGTLGTHLRFCCRPEITLFELT